MSLYVLQNDNENDNDDNNIVSNLQDLYINLVRTTDKNKIKLIEERLIYLISITKSSQDKELLNKLINITINTRDIINGKGEYYLFYVLVYVWHEYYPEVAKYLIKSSVMYDDNEDSNIFWSYDIKYAYGSWKDIKYFCNYCKDKCKDEEETERSESLIDYCCDLMIKELKKDNNKSSNISLAGKWCPRESSKKFGWLNTKIACRYHNNLNNPNKIRIKLINKYCMNLRKTLSKLNKRVGTYQIYQCNNKLYECEIDGKMEKDVPYSGITSITEFKQIKTLSKDNNYIEYLNKKEEISHPKTSLSDLVGKCINIEATCGKKDNISNVKKIINKQANEIIEIKTINIKENRKINRNTYEGNIIIPFIDTSKIKTAEKEAIGLGIYLAKLSERLSRRYSRLMLYNNESYNNESYNWINLENKDFYESVNEVKLKINKLCINTECKTKTKPEIKENSNLAKGFENVINLLRDIIIENKVSEKELNLYNIEFIIISENEKEENKMINDIIIKNFKEVDKGLSPPKVLYWNLKNSIKSKSNSESKSESDKYSYLNYVSGFNAITKVNAITKAKAIF